MDTDNIPDGIQFHQVDRNVIGASEIQKRFAITTLKDEEFTELQVEFIEFAEFLDESLNNGREKALALTALEECFMWTFQSVSRDNG